MSGAVRANWFVDEALAPPEEDAFGAAIEDVGLPIALDGEPRLRQELVELVTMESALDARGITCAVKDRADTSCSACPLACDDPDVALSALCRVGRSQERVSTQLAVLQHAGSKR